jgi:hypothetical protein
MGISISYVDINLTQVGTVPAADPFRPVVDKVLRESYLSAEYTFDPALGSIDVSVTNYREDPHGDHEHVLHFYSKNPVSYRDATAMEIELWKTYFWEAEEKLAKILNREFSGKLPKDMRLGQVRIDTLDKEIFTELWIPLAGDMLMRELETISRALNDEFAAIWLRVADVSNRVEQPVAFLSGPTTPSVFICHSTLDKPFVRRLCEELKKKKIRVWLDEEQILVGHDFVAKMEEGITASDFTAVILSPRFVAYGPWAKEEYRNALTRQVGAKRVVLLPVLLEACDIPPLLTSKKYADFTGAFEDGFKSLAFSIANHKR